MNNKTKPLVSVIMPAFNEPPLIISESIGSILHQTYPNIEIHIFDDSTNEGTRTSIDSFASYPNVFIHRSEQKTGFVKSLNIGLEISKGQYIARMDGDDIAFPDRIQKQVSFLESNPKIDILGGALKLINQKGKETSFRRYPAKGFSLLVYFTFRSPLAHPTVMMRRRIVEEGFRYDESLSKAEDLDLWLRLFLSGHRIANMQDFLLKYRITDNFIEKRSDSPQRKFVARIRTKNMTFRYPFFSLVSFLVGFVSSHLPKWLFDFAYGLENKS